jgi:hypothetical protein
VGSWYTIGLCLGLGLGLSAAITGILGSNVLGISAAAIVGAVLGGAIGLLIGGTPERPGQSAACSAHSPQRRSSWALCDEARPGSELRRTWELSACWSA